MSVYEKVIFIIRVDNLENLINDLSGFLKVNKIKLCSKILEMYNECNKEEYCFDDIKFFELASDYISKNNNDEIKEIYLCHLIRSIECPKELHPLHKVLTTKNALSDLLIRNGFSFKFLNNKIVLTYNGKEYSEEELGTPIEEKNYYGHLAVRFGYDSEPDYCINGFMLGLNPEHSTGGYYNQLRRGPEILHDIDRFFDTNLSYDFYKQSTYYFALIKVSLEHIIFDENEDKKISIDRTKLFLSYCFQAIYNIVFVDNNIGVSNPIIRLTDVESAMVESYIRI